MDLRQQAEYVAIRLLRWSIWSDQSFDYLMSWQGAGEIIEAMRERGWRAHLYVNGDYCMAFTRDDDEHAPDTYITHAQRTGLTAPEAILRAAYAALQERDR